MFPLALLTTLAGIGGMLFGQHLAKKNNNNDAAAQAAQTTNQNNNKQTDMNTENSTAKNVNTYNYYTNESENGNTLFGSQKKTKRTLFGANE